MRKTLTLALALTTAAVTATAFAQSQQAAQDLLDQGKWQEAAAAAGALGTSGGLALAAEATTLGAALSPDSQKKALFQKAQDYAKQAIAKDKNNATAYFEMARAEGRLAQFVGILQSLGLAGDMKKNLDKAVALDPKMAGAYVALGLWHANLDAKGFVARAATGANKAQVIPNFEKALALEPDVITHRVEYANALVLMGKKADAVAQLQKAVTLNTTTFWEKRDLADAQALLAKLK